MPLEHRDVGELDPLDVGLENVGATRAHRPWRWPMRHRLAAGLSPGTPGLPLLLAGAALGPHGVGLLSPGVLSLLDPAIPVALAALGILVGLDLAGQGVPGRRLLAGVTVEATLTVAVVAAGLQAIASTWASSADQSTWVLALALGLCAASSATVRSRQADDALTTVTRIAALDDLLPIVGGSLVLAFMREGPVGASLTIAAHAGGIALAIALAGWLLLTRSTSDTEQQVFAVAIVLLLGGAAEYLSLSALFCGLVAGVFWQLARGQARECIRRDLLHLQHPLVVLVLLVAGARVEPSTSLLAAAAYIFLRASAKMAGGWLAGRIASVEPASSVGLSLMSPGIVGIAFALNMLRAGGSSSVPVLAVAVVGAIGLDLMAAIIRPRRGIE